MRSGKAGLLPASSPSEAPADTHVLVLDGKLVMIRPFVPNPKTGALTLEPAGIDTFRIEGTGDGPLGELVTFEFGPDSRANKIIIGVNPSVRVGY